MNFRSQANSYAHWEIDTKQTTDSWWEKKLLVTSTQRPVAVKARVETYCKNKANTVSWPVRGCEESERMCEECLSSKPLLGHHTEWTQRQALGINNIVCIVILCVFSLLEWCGALSRLNYTQQINWLNFVQPGSGCRKITETETSVLIILHSVTANQQACRRWTH